MAFPLKLYSIVNDAENCNLISWNQAGDVFTIHSPHEFTEKILSANIVKTSNYSSFVRQLNIYDFHKLKKISNEKSESFKHKYFLKGMQPLLKLIKRKTLNSEDQCNIKTDLQVYSVPNRNSHHNQEATCYQSNLPLKEEKEIIESTYSMPKIKRTSKHNLHSIYSKFIKDVSIISNSISY